MLMVDGNRNTPQFHCTFWQLSYWWRALDPSCNISWWSWLWWWWNYGEYDRLVVNDHDDYDRMVMMVVVFWYSSSMLRSWPGLQVGVVTSIRGAEGTLESQHWMRRKIWRKYKTKSKRKSKDEEEENIRGESHLLRNWGQRRNEDRAQERMSVKGIVWGQGHKDKWK